LALAVSLKRSLRTNISAGPFPFAPQLSQDIVIQRGVLEATLHGK